MDSDKASKLLQLPMGTHASALHLFSDVPVSAAGHQGGRDCRLVVRVVSAAGTPVTEWSGAIDPSMLRLRGSPLLLWPIGSDDGSKSFREEAFAVKLWCVCPLILPLSCTAQTHGCAVFF